jgi:hypothetical protein
MGDARRRAQALAAGQPWPEDLHRCPACRSRRTAVAPGAPMALSAVPTLFGVCADCRAIWDAYPADWSHDVCEAGPCDNCAFRPESPEIRDRASWKALLARLKAGEEFRCHKGAPILIDAKAETVEFDAAWINRHGRTCAGFHRAIMTRPEWFAARYPEFAAALADEDAA